MADFNLDLASIADELQADYNTLVRRFTFGVYSRVIRKSPVDTGRFRGNWIISIGKPIGVSFPEQFNKNASVFVNNNPSTIESFDMQRQDLLLIKKKSPYAEKLKRGHSKQAPQGMLDISIREELSVFE
jgi:hypothetical protein